MTKTPLGQLSRLIFVLFSLFLLGDVFYRWDGFRAYSSFSEFVPAVALVFIQWSLVSVILTIISWMAVRLLYYVCALCGFRIKFDYLLLYLGVFVFVGALVWKGKKITLTLLQTTLLVKLIALLVVAFISLVLARILSNWFSRFLQVVQEKITPLVWFFGLIVFLSIPIVIYHAWVKGIEKIPLERTAVPSEAGKNRPNIILVTFDAMSAQDMSVYGYHRETTPFITEWAKDASLFTRVETASGFTTGACASLMTGKRPWSHLTWQQLSPIRKKKSENIARELKKNGYYTISYNESGNAAPGTLGIDMDFNRAIIMLRDTDHGGFLQSYYMTLSHLFHGKIRLYDWLILEDFYPAILFQEYFYSPIFMPIYTKIFSGEKFSYSREDTVLDAFVSDMDVQPFPHPFFAWIHVFPPHSPYTPPKSFQGRFDPSQRLRGDSEQIDILRRLKKSFKEGLAISGSDEKDIETLRARYDENITFCDKKFENFIKSLEKRNILENSVVILSADHGEIFEHNAVMHEETPYEPDIHIPLIIKEPNQREGKIYNDVIDMTDITATVLDLSGAIAPSWMEGRSLMPLISGKPLLPMPAFNMFLQRSRGLKIEHGFIAAYEGDYKLVYFLDNDSSLLFNLKKDPDEMNNLFNKEPETGKRLLELIKRNIEKADKSMGSGV